MVMMYTPLAAIVAPFILRVPPAAVFETTESQESPDGAEVIVADMPHELVCEKAMSKGWALIPISSVTSVGT